MRKTKDITVPGVRSEDQGQRDNGKTFRLTEMPARQAEAWADRALLCLAHSALNLPPGLVIERSGMAGVTQIAYLLKDIAFPELAPLMDELMGCVQVVPDPTRTGPDGTPFVRPLREEEDIEEVATRRFLRDEVMELHINFSLAASILGLIATASEMRELPTSETTPTSRRRSARSLRAA